MARLQIEPNLDGDAMLPGGRTTVHRLTLLLDPSDVQAILRGDTVKVSEQLPMITLAHLYLDVTTPPAP